MNRENLWNDPYHASDRTWIGYHSGVLADPASRARSVDAVHEHTNREAARRQFVMKSRETTRNRFEDRRKYNTTRSRARTLELLRQRAHRRQDVCSGMTGTIGGDVRDLPYKALRNIMTPLIEEMDTEAASRLEERLHAEKDRDNELRDIQAKRRAELLEDMKWRKKTFEALERLSGIVVCPRSPTILSPTVSKRTEELSRPREGKPIKTVDCLDGLELTHVSNPEVIETLHALRV